MQINLLNRRSWQASPYLRLCPRHHLVREALSASSTTAASESTDSGVFYILQNANMKDLTRNSYHKRHVICMFSPSHFPNVAKLRLHMWILITVSHQSGEQTWLSVQTGPSTSPPLPVTLWSGPLCFLMTHTHYLLHGVLFFVAPGKLFAFFSFK